MRNLSRKLVGVATVACAAYLALCANLYLRQRKLLYFPQPMAPGGKPRTLLRLYAGRPTVLVSARARRGPDAIVYFGGNTEDVSSLLPRFRTAFPRHALYLLHYRGYGGSEGEPGEAALVADALALFDRVRARHRRVIVVGRSLGSGLAVRVASEREVARLVLVTPYDSIVGVAAEKYPLFPVSALLHERYESGRHAPKVRAPVRILVAGRDAVIPRHSTDRLVGRFAPGLAQVTVFPEADHRSVAEDPRYLPFFIAP